MYKGLQTICNGRVLYLDMNSFFASVEQQYNPRLRNKPLAVVSHIAKNGTVLAASYEAKAFGIGTGTKLQVARELCPELLVTETNAHRYRGVHDKFMDILHNMCGPEVYAKSIDEAVIPLAPNLYGSRQCRALALSIKVRFKKELGKYIRCSIGIAPNTLLAKVASNLKKPDGLTEITLENLQETLSTLTLTDLPGIAHKNAIRLASANIETPLDFYNAPADDLQKWFGIWGRYWWWRLHGYEADGFSGPIKSLSHEHVLTKWIYTREALRPLVMKMADRLVHRLHKNELRTRTAWLYVSAVGLPGLMAERKFDAPVSEHSLLITTIAELLNQLPNTPPAPLRKITLGFNGLDNANRGMQLDLFDIKLSQSNLSQAVYEVRKKYGFESLQVATSLSLKPEVAKEHLGFGKIKDKSVSLPGTVSSGTIGQI